MKILILLVLNIFVLKGINAQISNPVDVTIELGGAGQFITVNHTSVELAFNSAIDYQDGVHSGSATKDHLTVGSTIGFEVVVKGAGDLSNGTHTIALNSIEVSASDGSEISGLTPAYFATTGGLSTSDQVIIRSTDGSPSAKFNIDYFAHDNAAYLTAVDNYGKSTYSTTIIYSILPD